MRGQWAADLGPLEELATDAGRRWSACAAQTLGYARAQRGEYVQAVESFQEALRRFRQDARTGATIDAATRETERA